MPSLTIPESGLSLGGSPAATKPGLEYPDMFSLSLADNVIEDMIKCVTSGKLIELSLGHDLKITYGDKTQHLTTSDDPFACEYLRTATPSTSSKSQSHEIDDMQVDKQRRRQTMPFGWMSTRRLVPSNVRTVKVNSFGETSAIDTSPHKETDSALAALQSSLASAQAKKMDNTTKHIKNTSALPPAVQQRGSAQPIKSGKNARFLTQNKNSFKAGTVRSMPTSPALTGISSPSLAPTSVPFSQQQAEKTKALRRPIIHKLALGPATEDVIYKLKRSDVSQNDYKVTLEKVADLIDGKWKLKMKSFRDLDVFNYAKYTADERQIAIDNAINAYDKLRLTSSEADWDRLLPMEERGSGKCLSKLQAKIAAGPIQTAKAPKIRVQGAEDSGRDTGAEDNDGIDLFGEKKATTTSKSQIMVRSNSNPPIAKSKKASEKEAQTKRLVAKPGKANRPTASKPTEKKSPEKESSKVKSSKFVSDSDEEDNYVIPPNSTNSPKFTGAKINGTKGPASKPVAKRAREEVVDVDVKPKASKPFKATNTSPQKSSPLASSPPTNASDFEDSSSSSRPNILKRKATDSSSDVPISKRHQKSSSTSTSSSVASSAITVSATVVNHPNSVFDIEKKRDDISRTKRFQIYYAKYHELWQRLNAAPAVSRDAEQMADLLQMHVRLAEMKADLVGSRA